MHGVGLIFVLIAALLTIKEVDLQPGWIVCLLLLGLAGASEFLKGFVKGGTLVLFAVAGLSTPLLFFLLRHRPAESLPFYIGTVVFLGLSIHLVFRTRPTWSQFDLRNEENHALNLESAAVWFAVIASSLSCLWSSYYQFLTPFGKEDLIERRLVFTLVLLGIGVVCTLFGRKSLLPFLGIMGLTFLVAGVAKALAYDTTHLTGFLRIGVFAGGGAVLLFGGTLMNKQPRPTL
jgi:hypothetical protein